MIDSTAAPVGSEFYESNVTRGMYDFVVAFCSLAFVVALITADVSNVKVFAFHLSFLKNLVVIPSYIYNQEFLLPAGTLAFSTSFIMTDVICELAGREYAVRVVFIGVFLRVVALCYFNLCVGGQQGSLGPLTTPGFWTQVSQQHYAFVLGGTTSIVAASVFSSLTSFMNDLYFFNYLRARHRGKNLFWLRNFLATALSQIVNSLIFITFAFGGRLSIPQISTAILGQLIFKLAFALIDAPLAYGLKNFGQGRRYWFAVWSAKLFWKG